MNVLSVVAMAKIRGCQRGRADITTCNVYIV